MNPAFTKAALLAGCSALFFSTASLAEPQVGNVGQRQFLGAIGTRETGEQRNLYFRETVYANEVVETGSRAMTNLVFLDNTNLFVGSNSRVVLDKFVYDPKQQLGDVAITFGKGAFRFITGDIENKENVSLKTPTATMTIRGTELLIFVLSDGTSEVNVLSGAVDLLPCEQAEPVRVEEGQAMLITSSCETTALEARSLPFGRRYPQMPPEYAALDDSIEPAAGDEPRGRRAGREDDHREERERPERPEPPSSPPDSGDGDTGDGDSGEGDNGDNGDNGEGPGNGY